MRADRLLSIMMLLQQKGHLTAEALAKHLEVSVRTIYRDIDALSFAGVPIYTQSGPLGGIFLDANYRIALTSLSLTELQSLFIEGAHQPLSDLGLGQAIQNSYLKLLATLPEIQRLEADRFRQRIYIDPKSWFQVEERSPDLTLLQHAVMEEKEIEFTYSYANGETHTRRTQPYGMVCKSNSWYLVGKNKDEKMRSYRISRFRQVRLLEISFKRDNLFNLKTFWNTASQAFEKQYDADFPVILRIKTDLLAYFEWYLTGRYKTLSQPDSQGWQQLNVLFYSLHEARMTVMGLGLDVEVIEPVELYLAVVDRAKEIIAHEAALQNNHPKR